MARDTSTGQVLEELVLPVLSRCGYRFRKRVEVGKRLGLGRHLVDLVVEQGDRRVLVSLKWQQVSGTAEQKVPFEVICLADTLKLRGFNSAYLVLGGEGWKLREFYISGGLDQYLRGTEHVKIVTLEGFIKRANQGAL